MKADNILLKVQQYKLNDTACCYAEYCGLHRIEALIASAVSDIETVVLGPGCILISVVLVDSDLSMSSQCGLAELG